MTDHKLTPHNNEAPMPTESAQNRCYPSDSEAAATGGDDSGNGFYVGPRIGSLCSGYGGLDLGLMAVVGGSVAWHVEYDKHPSAVLDARFPGVPNYGDVKTTDWTAVEPVDLFTAGYPCQPFSGAGLRLGEADERHLWPHIADAIRVLRPRRVLLENVAGHLSLGFGSVLGDLAALGYDCQWVCLRAADAGAPHNRARVFILATDTRRERHGSGQDGRSLGRVDRADAGEARQRERSRPVASDRSAAAPTFPERERGACVTQGAHATALECAGPGAGSGTSSRRTSSGVGSMVGSAGVEWGVYEPAIRQWEHITGRAAPRPTEPGRTGERLSPRFVEWLMGLPDGWVTDVAIPRNAQLKALGNGVVPQQAALAITVLMQRAEVAA